jgi:type II secretory pathway pseudopilin PulG
MLGVLAIVGVLSVGALTGYSMAMSKYKSSVAANQLEQIVFNIIDLYETANIKNHKSMTQNVLVQAGILPDDLVNVYGLDIVVDVSDTSIMLRMGYPDKSSCINILSSKAITNIGPYLGLLSANSNIAGPWFGTSGTNNFPLTISDINSLCDTETYDYGNIALLIYFTGTVSVFELFSMQRFVAGG